jgi:hypothetical protein
MAILSETSHSAHSKGGETHNQTARPEEKGLIGGNYINHTLFSFLVLWYICQPTRYCDAYERPLVSDLWNARKGA